MPALYLSVILYARAGAASTEFEGSYARGGGRARISERETGLRFGVGAEFPIGNGLSSLRIFCSRS